MARVAVNAMAFTTTESEPLPVRVAFHPKDFELTILVLTHRNGQGVTHVVGITVNTCVHIVADLYARESELGMVSPDETGEECTQVSPLGGAS